MLTRIEIDGFKTFEKFKLDLRPFSAVVGPNASGKSNLFDAIKFISLLARHDIRTAMQDLRGEPEELFRRTPQGDSVDMAFAVEVVLPARGQDAFGTKYSLKTQRIRYELKIGSLNYKSGDLKGIFVKHEHCQAIGKKEDCADFLLDSGLRYSAQLKPFIRMRPDEQFTAIEIRQDGASKRGRPVSLPASEASRSALSTVSTAEFPHLYALRDLLASTRFLEINPQAARKASDRFEDRSLKPDASNLSTVLAKMRDETLTEERPAGALSEISAKLSALIPSVRAIEVRNDPHSREYSFGLEMADDLLFSSRVISDGTLRLLALLTVLSDPKRKGVLCFEEPENGVHEGRIQMLVQFLRSAATTASDLADGPLFQIVVNTHSPAVMGALHDEEIVAADIVVDVQNGGRQFRTRMRTGVSPESDMFDPERYLNRSEVEKLLRRPMDAA